MYELRIYYMGPEVQNRWFRPPVQLFHVNPQLYLKADSSQPILNMGIYRLSTDKLMGPDNLAGFLEGRVRNFISRGIPLGRGKVLAVSDVEITLEKHVEQ